MNKIKIVIFTAWPQLIVGSRHDYEVLFEDSVDQALIATLGSASIDHGMERLAVRIHDRDLYKDFEYCLWVPKPVRLDLDLLLAQTDVEHSTYIGQNLDFVLYRRSDLWNIRDISVSTKTFDQITYCAPDHSRSEDIGQPAGIIFIDCWQTIMDLSKWQYLPYNFDFFANLKTTVCKYHPASLIFHTGTFGSLPLAAELESLQNQNHAVEIVGDHDNWNWQLEKFKEHYQTAQIYNWIVVGAHWQRCTHDKPLGFCSLLELKKQDARLKIYSHMDCTVKFLSNNNLIDIDNPVVTTCCESDYQLDSLDWKITGRLAELMGPL